ncbi:unnamed protein product [Paramecium sonneborni]|uniref:Trichocyst matrix protein n=1 Tax=Paramecium sonneborni TaxID=65129 RepID=A0A8S1NM42_9CILI|nr:unnamed protein product [Paramecium sonneborni]
MKAIFGLLAIIVLTQAGFVQKYPLNYSNKRNIMSIMTEVESKIQARNPLDTIKGILNSFKSEVASEQATHDEVYNAQKAECDSEIDYRSKEVQDANSILTSANGILKTARIIKGKTSATLEATEEILNTANRHIEMINSARKEDTQSYNRAAVSFNDAINAIDDSIDLATALAKGQVNFAQIAELSTKLLKSALATKLLQEFKQPMAALSSITQDEEAGAAERLVQLLQTLRTAVENAWTEYTTQNQLGLQQFMGQKDLYTATQQRLDKAKSKLVSKLEATEGVISVQTAVAQAATNRRSRNQNLWDDAADLCHSFDVEFETVTAGRRQELILINELERLATRRAAEQQI